MPTSILYHAFELRGICLPRYNADAVILRAQRTDALTQDRLNDLMNEGLLPYVD